MKRTTARERRIQQMREKGFAYLTPSEREASLVRSLDALKRLASSLDPKIFETLDEGKGPMRDE